MIFHKLNKLDTELMNKILKELNITIYSIAPEMPEVQTVFNLRDDRADPTTRWIFYLVQIHVYNANMYVYGIECTDLDVAAHSSRELLEGILTHVGVFRTQIQENKAKVVSRDGGDLGRGIRLFPI